MAGTIKVLVAPENVARQSVLINGLSQLPDVVIVNVFARWTGKDYAASLAGLGPDLFLIDSLTADAAFIRLIRYHTEAFPGATTILLLARPDAAFASQAMQAGAYAVFHDPLDWSLLHQAIRAAHQACTTRKSLATLPHFGLEATQASPIPQPSTVKSTIALLSAKDGEGKTTISVNLAALLAIRHNKRVVLLDLNTNFDDFTVLLNRRSPAHLLDVLKQLAQGADLTQVQESMADYRGDGRLRYLCGPCSIRPIVLEQGRLADLVQMLKADNDVVILDTPVILNEALSTALAVADQYLVVVQSHVASLRNTKAYLTALTRAGYPHGKVKIVLNRVSPTVGLSTEELERFIEPYPVVAKILSAGRLVIEALNEGVPFVLSQPKADISLSLQSLSTVLAGR